MHSLVLVLALLSLVKAQTTNVQQCTINPGPLPINAQVEGCLNPPCTVEPGGDAFLHLIFKAPHLITSMETLVTVEITLAGVTGVTQFPIEHLAATCNFLTNSYCPVLAGEVLTYSLIMPIPTFISDMSVIIEFYVVDEHKNNLVCVRVPIVVP